MTANKNAVLGKQGGMFGLWNGLFAEGWKVRFSTSALLEIIWMNASKLLCCISVPPSTGEKDSVFCQSVMVSHWPNTRHSQKKNSFSSAIAEEGGKTPKGS